MAVRADMSRRRPSLLLVLAAAAAALVLWVGQAAAQVPLADFANHPSTPRLGPMPASGVFQVDLLDISSNDPTSWSWEVLRDDGNALIGRMAVDVQWRRKGVGGEILKFLEDFARKQGLTRSVLHAQEYVKSFYAAHGYQQHGDTFLEVDIPHVEMRKAL